MRSLTLLILVGLALVGHSTGWDKGYHRKDTHHQYSVQSRKTSHRAKSTSISVTLIDATATSVRLYTLMLLPLTILQASHNPSASTAPTCINVLSGVKDEPAIRDPETTVILREKCGVTKETVDECPYLCGPNGDEPIKACFANDIAASPAQDFFGVCQHCLPPCDDKDGKDKRELAQMLVTCCSPQLIVSQKIQLRRSRHPLAPMWSLVLLTRLLSQFSSFQGCSSGFRVGSPRKLWNSALMPVARPNLQKSAFRPPHPHVQNV